MNFSFIGGDLRNIRLAQILSKENKIFVYGLEKNLELENENIVKCKSIVETIEKSKFIISSIPLSKDGIFLNSPYSNEKIKIDNLINMLSHEKVFISGAINSNICEELKEKSINYLDIMSKEEIAVLNTIATAEGTIKIAIESTEKNIQGSNILILGFGRVGKIVAKKFKALDSIITCVARKQEDLAWIDSLGYNSISLNKLLSSKENLEKLTKYDIVINTIPHMILTDRELRYINKDALIIDLASKPGGVDFNSAEKIGIKTIWALALPGKVSPYTSAKFIKDAIYKEFIL